MINIQQEIHWKELLKQHNMTQKELSQKMNVSEYWLSKLLTRDPYKLTLAQIQSIASGLGLNASILLQ